MQSFLQLALWRKPLRLKPSITQSIQDEGEVIEMKRTLGLFDLIMIGIGGTVGTGVFATSGFIASQYAGPAATLSWFFAGIGCILSGLSFMELACIIPTAEYGVSSAGGARSWSDKLTQWMESQLGVQGPTWMKPKDSVIDLYAGLLMAASTVIVLCGMKAGKRVMNGLYKGMVKTTSHLVGLVSCLAQVQVSMAILAMMNILATFALVGMQKYTEIDAEESYGNAFTSLGLDWAASFVASGEVLTMPVTSFIGFLAQPRLQYALAKDGLLPSVFAEVDGNGDLFRGTLLCGIGVTLLAVFVPFHVLWNFISLGILVAFNLTNSSLLFVRALNNTQTQVSETKELSLKHSHGAMIVGYVVSSFLAAFHWQKGVVGRVSNSASTNISIFDSYMQTVGPFVAAFFTVIAIALMFLMSDAERVQAISTTTATAASELKAKSHAPVEIVLSSKKQQDLLETGRASCRRRSRSSDREDGEDNLKIEDDDEVEHAATLLEQTSRHDQNRTHPDGVTGGSSEGDEDKIESSNISRDGDDSSEEVSAFRAPFVPFTPCVAIFFNWFLFAQMDGASVALISVWLLLAVTVYFGYSRHHSLAFQQTQYFQLAQQ
ncbi:unnamed protein product [Peronospora belbahrii]|uniref:Cationic amino acid transporter C-terminal domain-containing protein n=1 Tax=Peronospora belbahrii TaxID=622444 RepID=A0ABN8CRR8_9STRA|nr:unnamed protein product [Peronospora belbahrii]